MLRCMPLCHSSRPECVPLVFSQAALFRTCAARICAVKLLEIPQVIHPHPAVLAGIRAKYAGELVGKLDSIWTDDDMHPVLFTLEGAHLQDNSCLYPGRSSVRFLKLFEVRAFFRGPDLCNAVCLVTLPFVSVLQHAVKTLMPV